jgi:hypothetical protein
MRDRQPIRTALRKARQQERERQGLAVPACVLCIEGHHTAGRHHDLQLKAPLCEMHHREIHEQMRRAGVSLRFEPSQRKRVAMGLRGIAVYQHAQADALERMADLLDQSGGSQHER